MDNVGRYGGEGQYESEDGSLAADVGFYHGTPSHTLRTPGDAHQKAHPSLPTSSGMEIPTIPAHAHSLRQNITKTTATPYINLESQYFVVLVLCANQQLALANCLSQL